MEESEAKKKVLVPYIKKKIPSDGLFNQTDATFERHPSDPL